MNLTLKSFEKVVNEILNITFQELTPKEINKLNKVSKPLRDAQENINKRWAENKARPLYIKLNI